MSVRSAKILLVDDDHSLRRVLEFQLDEAGYSVVASGAGREALEFFSDEENIVPRGNRSSALSLARLETALLKHLFKNA